MTTENVQELCQKARQALATGDAQTARQCYFQALAQKPDSADIHYGLGTTCFLLHDLNGAAYHFNHTITLDPNRYGALINLGAVYNQMGKPDEALAILRQAIKLDPKRAEIYYNMGLAYRSKGQAELAIQAYRESIHLNPQMKDTHFNLANLLQDLGRLPQALVHYKEALKLDPQFQAAQVGVQQVEALLHPEHPVQVVKQGAQAKANPAVDMTQPIDPRFEGPALQALHRTTIVSENCCREFSQVMQEELEPAIKELSSTLLYSNATASDLEDRINRFEKAMNRTKALQRAWQQAMQKVAELNEQLMQPLSSTKLKALKQG